MFRLTHYNKLQNLNRFFTKVEPYIIDQQDYQTPTLINTVYPSL